MKCECVSESVSVCCVVGPFLPLEDLFSTNCDCNRKTNDYCDNDNGSNFHDIICHTMALGTLLSLSVCDWSVFLWRRRQHRRPIEHIQYTVSLLSYNALANDNTMIDIIVCKSGYTLILPVNHARKMAQPKFVELTSTFWSIIISDWLILTCCTCEIGCNFPTTRIFWILKYCIKCLEYKCKYRQQPQHFSVNFQSTFKWMSLLRRNQTFGYLYIPFQSFQFCEKRKVTVKCRIKQQSICHSLTN